jgi:hypothetical protein
MSLEQKIEELTHAVVALTQAVTRNGFMQAAMKDGAFTMDEVAAAQGAKVEEPRRAVEGEAAPKKPKKAEPLKSDLTYDQVATAFKKYISAAGRDQALELLATFDAKTLKDVPEAKWPLVMKACEQ